MYLFAAEDQARAAAGLFSVTYRLWQSAHVSASKTYPDGFGGAWAIEDVRRLRAGDIPASDLPLCGLPDLASVMALAAAHTHAQIDADTVLYRVQFHHEASPPPRPSLGIDVLRARLARLDAASPRGPWTEATLRLIADNPRVVARRLAAELDWPTADFKLQVRKLKALGLTLSHLVGYELSELGQAYLDALDRT